MPLYLKIISTIGMILLLLLSSIFSASETAYTSLSPGRIETMVNNKEFGAKLIKKQHKLFNQLLSTILICNNIVNIALSAITSYLLSVWWLANLHEVNKYNVIISTVILTPIVVLFGEILPKLAAKKYPVAVSKTFCYVLQAFYYIFWLFTYPVSKIGRNIYITNTEQDVKGLIDIAQNEGVLETNESIMAQNALDLDSTKVSRHYIKLKDVYLINYNDSVSDAIELFKKTNYSRLPVKKDDNLIGIIHLKDIFYLQKGKVITYLKPVPTISMNTSLSLALEKMRIQKSQMAFVTENNYSTDVIGLITMEDIIEEIIGEIYDEYDDEEWEDFHEISLELFHASGKMKLKEVIKRLEIEVENIEPNELNMSLFEFIKHRVGYSPRKNTKYTIGDVHFRILSITNSKKNDAKIEIELGNKVDMMETSTNQIVV